MYVCMTLKCKSCESSHIRKGGRHTTKQGIYQRYFCSDCGTTWIGEQLKEFTHKKE